MVTPTDSAPHGESLETWLTWLETIHPRGVDFGLDRIAAVAKRAGLLSVSCPLVTVGGTNGKGSVVAMLEAIYRQAGYRTGSYTSPHIVDFRERIRVDGQWLASDRIVAAFERIEASRRPQTLTYFEYTTLAAIDLFREAQCDIVILEVGLGGRLDAANLWDADVAVLTSIALDHQDYLGDDIGHIATEKAAIARAGGPLVLGEPAPPPALFDYVREQGIRLHDVSRDTVSATMALKGPHQQRNAACAQRVVALLNDQLTVTPEALALGLASATLAGRFEQRQTDACTVVLDVAHNPAGAEALVEAWRREFGELSAVLLFSALGDKDLTGVVTALADLALSWEVFAIEDTPRATPLEQLAHTVEQVCPDLPVTAHQSVESAWKASLAHAVERQCPVLVCGSFHTLAAVYPLFDEHDQAGNS